MGGGPRKCSLKEKYVPSQGPHSSTSSRALWGSLPVVPAAGRLVTCPHETFLQGQCKPFWFFLAKIKQQWLAPFRTPRKPWHSHTWRPVCVSRGNLHNLSMWLLPPSLLLGYLSSDGYFQDPGWNLFVSVIIRMLLQVLCFKLNLCLRHTKMGWHFQQAKNSSKPHPSFANSDTDFPFGMWPSFKVLGKMGISLLTFKSRMFFPLTNPLENHCSPIDSSHLFLKLDVCL